ncbi:helix-hairpin-helix domain-containing protein [Pseudopedobacter beijingensis]|uniref:Helix-hairpin-helix domain-containing protein n=1 Tax=Pseudopedobacter beijingensis TaxID=1207056 RepID=A0ABW4IFG8_9SPHI
MFNKVKSYFDISRREIRGMLVLFMILFLVFISSYVYEYFYEQKLDYSVEVLKPKIEEIEKRSDGYPYKESLTTENVRLFNFNPNGLPAEKWKLLGLSAKQINIIKNYEAKGGHFYRREDLKKIYSINDQLYKRLEPYIYIPVKEYSFENDHKREMKKNNDIIIDINSVDSISIQLVKGIGPSFGKRIVKYRDKLGGFVNKEQLREIWGLDSVKFDQIVYQINIDTQNVNYIYINNVSFEDIKDFPYLNYKQKTVLLAYRKQHGSFYSIQQLKKAAVLNDDLLEKIAPYIKFNDGK